MSTNCESLQTLLDANVLLKQRHDDLSTVDGIARRLDEKLRKLWIIKKREADANYMASPFATFTAWTLDQYKGAKEESKLMSTSNVNGSSGAQFTSLPRLSKTLSIPCLTEPTPTHGSAIKGTTLQLADRKPLEPFVSTTAANKTPSGPNLIRYYRIRRWLKGHRVQTSRICPMEGMSTTSAFMPRLRCRPAGRTRKSGLLTLNVCGAIKDTYPT